MKAKGKKARREAGACPMGAALRAAVESGAAAEDVERLTGGGLSPAVARGEAAALCLTLAAGRSKAAAVAAGASLPGVRRRCERDARALAGIARALLASSAACSAPGGAACSCGGRA